MIKFSKTLPTLEESDFCLIKEAMRRSGNNPRKAAEMIGCSRQNIVKRLKVWKKRGFSVPHTVSEDMGG